MAKPSRPLSEIPNTPLKNRPAACLWPKCRLLSIPGTKICRKHLQEAAQANADHAEANRRPHALPTICIMPGCNKTSSDMPWLRLCNAHLAIIHQEVENKTFGLSSVQGHQTRAQRQRIDERMRGWEEEYARARMANATVYYVQVGAHIKIGWTTDLERRMRSYPPNSQLLATHPGDRAEEAKMHRRFAVHRTHGREWYAPVPSLLHHIDMVKAKHGEPDHVAFGAQPVKIPRPHSAVARREALKRGA